MGMNCSRYLESNQLSEEKKQGSFLSSIKSTQNLIPNMPPIDSSHALIHLTERQKEILIGSFAELKHNLSQVGVLTFLRLFETHPEVQGFFGEMKSLSLINDLPQSRILRQHALRIMNFLEKCISRIYRIEKMDELIKDLGLHHVKYGAPAQYIHLIGPQFISAVKPQLESKWDLETEEAWLRMFSYIAEGMTRAMNSNHQ